MEQTQRKPTRNLMTDELGNGWILMVRSDGSLHTEPARYEDYGSISYMGDDGEKITHSFAPSSLLLESRVTNKAESDGAE